METFPGSTPESKNDDDDDDSPVESASDKKSDPKGQKRSLFEGERDKKTPEKSAFKALEAGEEHDKDVPDDKLDAIEKKVITGEYLDARPPELQAELLAAPAETSQEAEVLANIVLVETIKGKIDQGELPNDQTFDESLAETVEQLGIGISEPSAEDIPEAPEPSKESLDVNETESDEEDTTAPLSAATNTQPPTNPPVIPPRPVNVPPPPIVPPIVNNNIPPIIPPINTNGPGGRNIPPFNPYGPGPNPNTIPPNPNTNPNQPPVVIERRSSALPYLVVGYLLGRRRGRIKTERKLLPVQHKLEQEVGDLHKSIAMREEKIRTLVRERVAAKPATAEQILTRLEKRKDPIAKSAAEMKIRSEPETAIEAAASAAMVERMMEASEEPENKRPEKIGKLAVTYEKPGSPEKSEPEISSPELATVLKVPEIIKVPERPKSVEIMTQAELLVIAERIAVDSAVKVERSNVKKLFEANRLNDEGLRRVVQAFMRGERYERVIKDNLRSGEVATFEKSFEQTSPKTASDTQRDSRERETAMTTPAHSAVNATPRSSFETTHNDTSADSQNQALQTKKSLVSRATPIAIVIIIAILLVLFLLR